LNRFGGSAAILLAASCGGPAPLRIAVVGSAGSPSGAVLAVEDINVAGGINGRLLELGVVNDTRAVDPRNAIATAESLAADSRVVAVIGHGGSAASLSASQVYNARHLPQVAPNSSSPLYTHAGPYSFRLVASDEHQAGFIVSHIAAMAPTPSVAVLYVNDDYGRALNEFLQSAFRAANVVVTYDAPFLAGTAFARSLDEIVRSLVNAKPTLLVWVGLPEELGLLRTPLRKALPHLRVFGSDGVSFVGALSGLQQFEGDLVVAYADVTADRPALRGVASRFESLTGRAFTDGAALTYDAVGIIAQGMRAGATDREGMRKYLESSISPGRAYQGITGAISFDTSGDALPSYVLFEIINGKPTRVVR
jgi:branched-chain amino acid transport system substrate-binding protein